MSSKDGFVIACAWPETWCKQPGSWYDNIMNDLRFSRNGYYKVGHAALVLVHKQTGVCEYFDFGRYHAPHGFGRVRNAAHDHELKLHTKAHIQSNKIVNLNNILQELHENESCHGQGILLASYTSVHFQKVATKIQDYIRQEFIPYGPFTPSGTNCSRFVNTIIRAGRPSIDEHVLLKFPLTISPTPLWNLKALQHDIVCVGATDVATETNQVLVTEYAARSTSSTR